MTEQEYMRVSDKSNLRMALAALSELYIDTPEIALARRHLCEALDKCFAEINLQPKTQIGPEDIS